MKQSAASELPQAITALMQELDLHTTAELMRYAITQGLAVDQP